MDWDWSQVLPVGAVCTLFGGAIGYVGRRLIEKRHLDEELDRGSKAIRLANELFDLHQKACDRSVNMKIPIGKRLLELMPVTDEEIEETQEQEEMFIEMARWWLFSLLWHCVDIYHLEADMVGIEAVKQRAEESFMSAYNEFEPSTLLYGYPDSSLTTLIHNFFHYLNDPSEANQVAVGEAMKAWWELNNEDG